MQNKKTILLAIFGCSLLAAASQAQITNPYYVIPPCTKLEALERGIGTIVISASSPIGTIAPISGAGSVTVNCKQDRDAGSGLTEHGISMSLESSGKPEETVLVDYDEIAGLLKAIDQLEKLDWSITPLASFRASYETKAGFRVAVFSSRRSGAIEVAIRNTHGNIAMILTRDQLAQLRRFIEEAQNKIAKLMKGNAPQ